MFGLRYGEWFFVFFVSLFSVNHAMGDVLQFKKVISTWDSVPSQPRSSFLGIGSPTIGKKGVTVVGNLPIHGGSSGGTGLYFCPFDDASGCLKVIDGFTDFPNGVDQITGVTPASVDGDEITFAIFGSYQQQAIVSVHRDSWGDFKFVATQRTLNVAGPKASIFETMISWPYYGESQLHSLFFEQLPKFGVLQLFFLTSADQGVTSFTSIPTLGSPGVYLRDGTVQYQLVNDSDVEPVLLRPFLGWAFSNVTTDRWVTAFGATTDVSYGIYKRRYYRPEHPWQQGWFGDIAQIAVSGMSVPDTNGVSQFVSFGDQPSVRNDRVAFYAQGSAGDQGLYIEDSGLHTIANIFTEIPNGTGTFTHVGRGSHVGDVCLTDDSAVFRGEGSGGQIGIYVWDKVQGRVHHTKLIDLKDTIAGVGDHLEIQNLDIEPECAEGERVVISVEFRDKSTGVYQGTGVYLAKLPKDDGRFEDVSPD